MNKVVITARSFATSDESALKLLKENDCQIVRLIAGEETVEAQLEREITDADAVIAGLESYTRELICAASRLKVISRYGVGYDKVDLNAAKEKGVAVTYAPGANGDSVADLAVTLMLCAARNVTYMDRTMKRPVGMEMFEKTLGIVGVGRIGKGVAKRCTGFGMNILLYDAFYEDKDFASSIGATYVDFDTLVKEADFISLHADLNESTRNLFDETQFRRMKNTAVLVNTARGGIVDEHALYQALKNGEIYAAALDAVEDEANEADNPLRELDNCILTPHAGAATREASSRTSLMAAQNVIDILSTGTCEYIVPPLK